ncbi:MAG: hypothetical protein ACC619_04165, partial [Paracoccaceae bacterium]
MTGIFSARVIAIAVTGYVGLLAMAASAQQLPTVNGQPFASVQNWQPNDFSISCGTSTGTFRPQTRQTACMSNDQARIDFEINTWLAARFFQTNKFESPYHFGPVINGFDGAGETIRVFSGASAGVAASVSPEAAVQSGDWCDREGFRVMEINPSEISKYPGFAIAFVGSHELFHAVQMGIPGNLSKDSTRLAECYLPKWIDESQADASGIDFTRREFPDSFPPKPKQKFGANMAGIRPYWIPLNFKDKSTDYDTNSFWLYLGDRFHGKRFKYMLDYISEAAPIYGGGEEDWLRWLDQQLLKDPDVKAPLSLVYPAFLTNFAGEWAPGGIGENFGRTKWLTRTFGACEKVTVSPQVPYVEIDIGLQKVAGKCLSVTISGAGLNANDLASVKIGALTDRKDIADALHLGFAFTNDQTGFNCAQITRQGKLPSGIVGCLLEPVTGVFETPVASLPVARMWNGTSVEKGPGPVRGGVLSGNQIRQANVAQDADIENVYILSYVPTKPWQEILEGKPPITVKIGVGLDVTTLTVGGSNVNSGAADGKRRTTRMRAASGLASRPADTDRIIPASTGYIDMDQAEEFFGQGIVDQLASTTEMLSAMYGSSPGLATFDTFVFRVAEVRVTPFGVPAPIDDELLDIVREYTVFAKEELPLGTTGTFDAMILGVDFENTNVGYITMGEDWAKLTVLENSSGAFRARVSGRLCQLNALAFFSARGQLCKRIIPFSATITKPFGYLYQANTELISQQTEGEEIYNEYNLARSGLGGPLAGGSGGSGSGPGDSSGPDNPGSAAANVFSVCPEPLVWRGFSCQPALDVDG